MCVAAGCWGPQSGEAAPAPAEPKPSKAAPTFISESEEWAALKAHVDEIDSTHLRVRDCPALPPAPLSTSACTPRKMSSLARVVAPPTGLPLGT